MNIGPKTCVLALSLAGALPMNGPLTQARAQETHFSELANLPFAEGRPTAETTQKVHDELLFPTGDADLPLGDAVDQYTRHAGRFRKNLRRWIQRPANLEEAAGCQDLGDDPNSDVLYAMSYVDLGKDGPLVMDAPPELQGILLDYWQRPIPVDGGKFFGDVGFAGPDGGKGGKFLLLPPGYKGTVPEGYFVYRSSTKNVFIFLRGFFEEPKNLTPAVAHLERTKIYPLNGEATAKPMKFPDASGIPVNMLPISDGTVFEHLKRLVDSEGDDLAGPDWLGMLAAIGIVKDQPFAPDTHAKEILDQAAKAAYRMSRVIGFEQVVGGLSYKVYPDRHWANPMADGTPAKPYGDLNLSWMNTAGGYLALDSRINFFTNYYSISPGMVSYTPGRGANYMIGFTDSEGAPLFGGTNYRVNLPPKIPARIFWSMTLYDAENSSGLANAQPFPSLGSRDKPTQNADGSTDLYFGPKAPEGKQGNWLATVPGKAYFVILRLYGPAESAIDKSWTPSDITLVK